ncbi:unnamed protein product [Rotaria magnacalcarata]|uniref:F-box domain-containing protein n=1 Tax=Rotaria magnacalcarata TaxID=392030 RepID=A0A820E7D6_9BILA|nr:unnamed protein product [Rotaria magnacalcarata]CAF4243905.1 unnamed protein product [Rotaria magnacalcarata]
MSVSLFEILPDDILYEIFRYLSPIDVLQSFLLLSKRFSRVIRHEYLWHIHIGDSTMSLMMFNDHCHNVLKLIGNRIVSLRLTLNNVIGGWSLISSFLRYHQTILLQRLHLIDIKPHEFDKLLRNHFIKQLHTLLVDVTPSNPFNCLQDEGIYLVKVCSRMPRLRICRLAFNHKDGNANQIETCFLRYHMTLSNLLNSNHLRTLTIGIHTSHFLERLLLCMPFIENLSFGIRDRDISETDVQDRLTLPATIDAHLLQYLSRLRIHCLNNISFHRATALLSSILSQLCHLSLKLEADTLISGPAIISGDIIQQLYIDRLKPMATYSLNLLLYVEHDLEEKIIFNSFLQAAFTHRQKPRTFVQECNGSDMSSRYHCFMVYTLPYNGTILLSHMFSTDLEKSCQIPTDVTNLFPHANILSLCGYKKINRVQDLGKSGFSISSLVPWSLLTRIQINHSDVITQHALQGILIRTILHNKDNFGTRINQQIKSLHIYDVSSTLQSVQRFCTLLSNQFSNLKTLSFNICDSYLYWQWKPSRINDGKNKSTKRIINLIYLLVNHLQLLVWLRINFCNMTYSDTPCFPHLIRRQLHQYPLTRPCRLRCSSDSIQIWL